MALYPSLEDMKVDQMMKAQLQSEYGEYTSQVNANTTPSIPSAPIAGNRQDYDEFSGALYPALRDYMGLELTAEMIEANMPEYSVTIGQSMAVATSGQINGMIAPISGDSLGLQRAQVTNGIRELTLCKDKDGKIGLRVHSINSGIFVCLVSPNSPAALAGLRFGDQILDINGTSVAGFSMDQVHKLLKNAPVNGIKVIVRDRPFERTVTMHRDSSGQIGFQFKEGKIIALVKDSSAARNGLLTDHQILEINGKNVVGLKDKDIAAEISNGPAVITITVIPSYIYDHMIKKMSSSLLKLMDHSSANF
ncbi:syntenin-1 [Diachasma alloeum]|uniref:syntenin-1 n=1 Tax=Diachasma alloeum TaxID=454923 RepID=UPI0007382D3D|nr:syntenin-1 [Diachasma alloeum]XP_015113233.1 syntenin-1 [Diachasma alloeum]